MENENDTMLYFPTVTTYRQPQSKVLNDPKSARLTLIKRGTGPDVGPGRYDEKRTNFPKTDKYGELTIQDYKKFKPQYVFKSNSPRIRPFHLTDAPLPGKYESASFVGEIIKKNAKLKPLRLNKARKSVPNFKYPGPSDYKVIETLKFIDESPYKNKRSTSIFISKSQRTNEKSPYYTGMESPAVGNYNEISNTIEMDMAEQMKKVHSEKVFQKNLPSLGFNSRVCRFDACKESEVGPGRYLNITESNFGKAPITLGKSIRFIDLSEIKKYPGPGSYQINEEWYKPGFNLLNPKF